MFFKFVLRALQYRKQRLTLAFAALAVGATLATVLFGIYGSVEGHIRNEFRSYGANIVAVPSQGQTIPVSILNDARRQGAESAPFLITSTLINGHKITVAEFDPEASRSFTTYWKIKGTRNGCLAGELLHLDIGTQTPVCTVKGILTTGGPEDNELLVPLANPTAATFIEIRAPGERLEAIRAALAKQHPEAAFRTVQSVAGTESNVILKIRGALFLLTLLILAITTLCVASNFSEMVLERAKEIGILKALGANEKGITAFFIAESTTLSLLASIAGYIAGLITAAEIGKQIFGGAFQLDLSWLVPVSVIIVMLAVSALATAIATKGIQGIQPAVILRGE